MKKVFFAVATAMIMGLSLSSCGGNKIDAAIDDYEAIVEKLEKAAADGDQAKAIEVLGDLSKWADKYKDIDENDFTDAQKKRYSELLNRASNLQ